MRPLLKFALAVTGLAVGCAESGASSDTTERLDSGAMLNDAETAMPFSSAPDAASGHCLAESFPAEPMPLELLVLLDSSMSMAEDGKWDAAVRGIMRFADTGEITKLSLAVSVFPLPLGDECKVDRYGQPLVPMQRTPDVASVIKQAFFEQLAPDGLTSPVRPALDGALQYLRARAEVNPFVQRAVVLVTDGLGNRCDTSNETVLALAQTAIQGTPALPIFVLTMPGGAQQAFLDQLAMVGGTERAFAITPEQGAEVGLVEAMQTTREHGTACTFSMVRSEQGVLNPSSVHVDLRTADHFESFRLLDRPERCAGDTHGFYYDQNDAPNLLTLCPAACTAAKAADGALTVEADCLWTIE